MHYLAEHVCTALTYELVTVFHPKISEKKLLRWMSCLVIKKLGPAEISSTCFLTRKTIAYVILLMLSQNSWEYELVNSVSPRACRKVVGAKGLR